jgi:hypothetical protein
MIPVDASTDVNRSLLIAEEEDDLAPRDLDDILGFKVRSKNATLRTAHGRSHMHLVF